MSLQKVNAIIYKQVIDIKRNIVVLFLIVLYPIMTFLFYYLLKGNPTINFVLPSFITLNIVMTPIITMSNIISEEKEKGTLRMLVMSNVKPFEYLLGVGLTLFAIVILTLIPYVFLLGLAGINIAIYFSYCILGVFISLIIGAIIGIVIKSQVGVGAISAPVSMVFGMIPMLTNFKREIENVSRFLYSQQIYNFLKSQSFFEWSSALIVLGNLIICFLVFFIVYKRKGIE